ncbi:MAG: hypothetical protein C0501_15420 [Isosphaera sp.]|nr:hypothetical protein [Isosphaera sp.]
MFRTRLLLALLAGTPAGSAAAAAPSPDPASLAVPADQLSAARELVRTLGSDQFADRERAERELADLGRVARAALLEGANTDPSPEVRSRCHALLPRATALEMRARVEVFLADADGRYEHDLPGWPEFRAVARNEWTVLGHLVWSDRSVDKAARAVFADLMATRPNRHLLAAVGGPDLGAAAAARRQELYSLKYPRAVVIGGVVSQPRAEPRNPTTADLTALLLAETLAPTAAAPRTVSISNLLTGSAFGAAVQTTGDQAKVLRAVAGAWLTSRRDPLDMYNAVTVATSLGLSEEACRAAARLLEAKGAQVYYRGNAAATLVRLGNASHLPLVERALADDAVLVPAQQLVGAARPTRAEIQVRDVALAVSVLLSGQKLADYGFADLYPTNPAGGAGYTYTRHYFPDGEQRKAALVKWAWWRAKNR